MVASDASNLDLGDVLLHKESNDRVKAIAHASWKIGYSQIEKEDSGIIFAVKGSIDTFMEKVLHFKLPTDRYCLFWFQKKDPYTHGKSISELGKNIIKL